MAKNNNLTDFLTDIANAIRAKKGISDPINAQNFATEISTISGDNTDDTTPSVPAPVRPAYTGHADAEGLRAIGWTDEDIAYYQENGVNWNEEDDDYHKVTDDNKALYGVLTADNISTYKDRIVYLPKIDISGKTSLFGTFYNCTALVALPKLDTSNVTNMETVFSSCTSLTSIPELNTSNVKSIRGIFENCTSLRFVPQLDTSNVRTMRYMFNGCHSLTSIPQLDTSSVTNMGGIFSYCYGLTHLNLKNAKLAYDLSKANLLSKSSLLYLINNESAESAITIQLASYAYERLATDPDVVAALANHPNISLAK